MCATVPVLAAAILLAWRPPRVEANCVADMQPLTGDAPEPIWFPNWEKVYAAAFGLTEYAVDCGGCCGGTALQLDSLTIANFGTATSGQGGSPLDIKGVFWRTDCDAAGAFHTMTAAAPQAWTWAWNGVEANPNLITKTGVCSLRIYADVAAVPTDGATVQLGVPYDAVMGVGGLADLCSCNVSWADVMNPIPKTIQYVAKFVDRISAAPGDTLLYTLYYGRPGSGSISNLELLDTQPSYTHYEWGSASVSPDPGWDPDIGPPLRLKWTIPGPLPTAGGPTGEIVFALTVDWGNGEAFEPGSGDTAAPEAYSLWNQATATFPNLAAGQRVHDSNRTRTTVMRYLFWKLADRDVLYAYQPTQWDEITYEIFVKNLSPTKTWWNVSVWDTVPAQVDPWQPGYGMDDPCLGWTMTPSGCAAAAPGRVQVGTTTILTWRLDMAPGMTLTVRWKAKVASSATSGATAVNRASVLAFGRTGIVGGTGHAQASRNFTHEARVVLRTSYVSYVSYTYSSCFGASGWYFIAFYPLHPAASWQLYMINGACGLNPPINTLAPSAPCNTWPGPGCNVGIERVPQYYGGAGTHTACAAPKFQLYKLVSNAPILWEVNPLIGGSAEDSMMHAEATTLSFKGKALYTYRRQDGTNLTANYGDYLACANTKAVATTLHLFQWDPGTLSWSYRESRDVEASSQWVTGGTPTVLDGHWRIISSDSDLIVWKGYAYNGITDYDNFVTMCPATNGNLVAGTAGDEFYVYAGQRGGHTGTTIAITNLGGAAANYEIWAYRSFEPLLVAGATPAVLGGASGAWVPIESNTVPAGIGNVLNPYIYGNFACTDQKAPFTQFFDLYRVILLNSVPIQVRSGRGLPNRYGGYVIHGVDSGGVPAQTVDTFWFNHRRENGNMPELVAFCPTSGMTVNVSNEDGYTATYVTTAPDQPIVTCDTSGVAASCMSNFVTNVLAPPGGRIIGMVNGAYFTERHYAAPFLAAGTHYEILTPPVVYAGQSFWITVVVLNVAGGTKTDYCGTSSFTSTDPGAKIEGQPMDTYNYAWEASGKCGTSPYDNGVRVFVNVTMTRLGLMTIVASDTVDGSVTGLATVMVVGADVKLFKEPRFSVQASGDTVRFRICWSNYSSASAFTFTVTDAVPVGTTYLPEAGSAGLDCGNTRGVPPLVAYSLSASPTPPPSFTDGNPASGARWLRWTVPQVGIGTTGCLCFRVTVD